jgi:apolipoprotein N-acyltransferase
MSNAWGRSACFVGAAALSLSARDFGTGYLALVAFLPCIHVCLVAERARNAALSTLVIGLAAAVVAGEGILHISPWSFVAVVSLQASLFCVPGLFVFWTRQVFGATAALLSFPMIWVGFEWLMNVHQWWGQFASPLSIAYSQVDTVLLSMASWSSTSGVTAVLLYANAALYAGLQSVTDRLGVKVRPAIAREAPARPVNAVVLAGAALILVAVAVGDVGIETKPEKNRKESRARTVSIVQGASSNVETRAAKYDRAVQHRLLDRYKKLTHHAAQQASIVVWPESGVPMIVDKGHRYPKMEQALQPATSALVGALVHTNSSTYNSVLKWNGHWYEEAYRKRSLVPVMEASITPGSSSEPITVDSLSVGAVICMESAHAEVVRAVVKQGASVLAVLTNDTALGRTNTPHWHLKGSIFRAVETGRYVIHASQSGPSGIVSPTGEVRARSSIGETTTVTGQVQPLTASTLYVAWGDWLGIAGFGICLLVVGKKAALRVAEAE